jgi:hypothetical protein
MAYTTGIHIAIFYEVGVYKHWALFLDGDTDDKKLIVSITGSSPRCLFAIRKSNPRNDDKLAELIHMCDFPLWSADAIIQAAVDLPVHNQYPGHNSQEYVLEILEDLEDKGLIKGLGPTFIR